MISTTGILYKNFRPYAWHITLLGFLGFLSGLFAGVGASAIVPLLTFVVQGPEAEVQGITKYVVKFFEYMHLSYTVYSLLLFIIILFLLRAATLFIFSYIRAKIALDYRLNTVRDLLSKVLSARWSLLLKQKTGNIHNILIRDVEKSAELLTAIAYFLLSFVSVIIFLAFAVMISPRIMMLTAAGGVAILFILKPLLKKTRQINSFYSKESKNVSQYLIEHLLGIKSIKSSASENAVFEKGMSRFDFLRRLEFKAAILGFLNRSSLEPLSIIFIAYIFAFSYNKPGFSIQVFAATIYFIQRIFVYFEGMQSSLDTINATIPNMFEIKEFRELLSHNEESSNGNRSFEFQKELVFKDVSFFYLPKSDVLSEINFSLHKGEVVGLIGPSGSGKTSIADLLLRLFTPSKGEILLDGVPAGEFALKEWRSKLGHVSQDFFLFNDTIERNIRFYNDAISDEEIIRAARQAQIYDFIQGLPDRFKTVVGERGVILSGGQRQRIVLARALARSPEILILDEATSALDNESEVLIQKAIQDLRGKVTVFVIAHRLSTVVDVDRLLVLDHGKIMEEGKPRDLLRNPESYFYKMHHLKDVKEV